MKKLCISIVLMLMFFSCTTFIHQYCEGREVEGTTDINTGVESSTLFSTPKRVILLGWDGVQRNHLKELLEVPGELPNLKALAAEGTIVDIDITEATDTKAGWAQILTGYTSDITGVHSNSNYRPIPEGYTIFERLSEHFGKGAPIEEDNVFTIMVTGKSGNLGSTDGKPYEYTKNHIDRYELDRARIAPAVWFGYEEKGWLGAKYFLEEYLRDHSDEHLFAFIHFCEPDHPGHANGENSDRSPVNWDPEEAYNAEDLYYGDGIRVDDYYLGKLVEWLKDKGLYDTTLIYVTSDHGFDEESAMYPVSKWNPGYGHAMAPYVFLATNDPGVKRAGNRMDVAPTILERFGVDLSSINPPLSGASLTTEEKTVGGGDPRDAINPKNIILISWSGVERGHLETLMDAGRLPNLMKLYEEGRFVEIDLTHSRTVDNLLSGTDATCGIATLLTGYDPDTMAVYNYDRVDDAIPKGYTLFERLDEFFGTNDINNIMVIGQENEKGEGLTACENFKKALDVFEIGVSEVGERALQTLDDYGTDGRFFALFHFSDPDSAGHKFGEDSSEYEAAIEDCDYWLGEIMLKLDDLDIEDETLIYVTSSHGFDDESAIFPVYPEKPGYNHYLAPYVSLATNDPAVIRHGNQRDIAPTILERFGIDTAQIRPILPGQSLTEKKKPWDVEKDMSPPYVDIVKPREKRLYFFDKKVASLKHVTMIIGRITLKVDAVDYNSGVDRVEFYVDDELKLVDCEYPYEWLVDFWIFGECVLKAVVYDEVGNPAMDKIKVIIFNIGL
jgi:arylsulfatase A-like enzyme